MAGYRVRVDGRLLRTVAGTSTQATGLSPGTHTFAVRAYDAAGNVSPLSRTLTVPVP